MDRLCLTCDRRMLEPCQSCTDFGDWKHGDCDMRKLAGLSKRAKLVYLATMILQVQERGNAARIDD